MFGFGNYRSIAAAAASSQESNDCTDDEQQQKRAKTERAPAAAQKEQDGLRGGEQQHGVVVGCNRAPRSGSCKIGEAGSNRSFVYKKSLGPGFDTHMA